MKQVQFIGVGVGPGDPEDMTLKAVRVIRESDILLFPSEKPEESYAYQIVKEAFPEIEEKENMGVAFPMTKKEDELEKAHARIAGLVISFLKEGKQVAFLTIGDPTIYATYSYIHNRVMENGYEATIVNGVPSFCATAGKLGISLAEKDEEIHIIPGSYELEAALQYPGTKVFMKSGKKWKHLMGLLEQTADIEVWAVSNCGMPQENIMIGLEQVKEADAYLTTVIVKKK